MNNLLKRAITGIVYVLSVIVALFIHPMITAIYFFVVAMIGLWEFYNIVSQKDGIKPNTIIGILLAIVIYMTFVYITGFDCELNVLRYVGIFCFLAIIPTLIVLFVVELYRNRATAFVNIAYTLLGVIYVVIPLALTNLIIHTDGQTLSFNLVYTPMVLMSVFIFAWSNDTFAYLTGIKFGKHKLFERISPKKTWEGWIGGFVFTIIAAVIVSYFTDSLSTFDFIVIAVITSVIGTFGDLIESMLKRQVGVKDSGNILPGHGGILDRFDILLLVLPAVTEYFFIKMLFIN